MSDLQFFVAAIILVAVAIGLHGAARAAENIADALFAIADALQPREENKGGDPS